ncbi:hypothetical protein LLG46_05760 [bacterium]|nr:hypothetical protein [bacterium]
MIIPQIVDDYHLRDLDYSRAVGSVDLARHRWYFVKEAFSPFLVREALKHAKCKSGDVVVDPFCGSGTVPLVASETGIDSTSLEVNPFLAFVSQTKLLNVSPVELEAASHHVFYKAERGMESPLEGISTFSEASKKPKWLFNAEVLRAFEGGWNASEELDKPVGDICRLALIGAAMDSCNAIKDGKCLRYRRDWKYRRFGHDTFLRAYGKRIFQISDDLACLSLPASSSIRLGDSRLMEANAIPEGFKLCVTSPPYLNSFDYSDVYRPELFLGKFVSNNAELTTLRLSTIRSHVQANWKHAVETDFGSLYNESYKQIEERAEYLWNDKVLPMIPAYFEDIKHILQKLRSLARVDASLWLVVATSAYAGVEIPVDLIIADIGSKVGWHLREVGVLRYLRTTSHHWRKRLGDDYRKNPLLRESVVVFDASPRR